MFDSHHHHSHHHSRSVTVSKVVTEHRAPTDESIRLLEEMREKVIERIVEAFPVKVSTIEGAAMTMFMVPQNNAMEFRVKFNLNGTSHVVRGELSRSKVEDSGAGHYQDPVREAMAREIAETITGYLMNQQQ